MTAERQTMRKYRPPKDPRPDVEQAHPGVKPNLLVTGLGVELAENHEVVLMEVHYEGNDRGKWIADSRTFVLSPPAARQLARQLRSAVREHLNHSLPETE